MRNLKRVLSLAMAALMLMGMMVVSAGAASTYDSFTDKDEIVNTEAVNTIVSLGVMGGKPGADGTLIYDPAATVKRGEMAKIIALCLNGGKEPVLGNSTNIPKFSDVPTDHWAYNYIAYCVQLGIIAGHGDGTFAPEAPVTGSQAAKMFLCALGYRADLEGLVGAEWELNTNILANQEAGLYDGLETIMASEGLTRDNTAQMAYNAIQAYEVQYRNLEGSYEDVLQTTKTNTMLYNRFNVVKVTGILEANDKLSVANNTVIDGNKGHGYAAVALEGKSLLNVTDVTGGADVNYSNLYGAQTFTVETSDEMVGQEIVIYVKFLNALAPNASGSTVVGEPILTSNNTVVETSARMDTESAVRTALRAGGMANVGTPIEALYTQNTVEIGTTSTKGVTDSITKALRGADKDGDGSNDYTRSAGIFQRFIDNNGDGTPDYIIQIVPVLTAINSISTDGEDYTFTGISETISVADIVTDEELARNDVVLVNKYADDCYYVSYPETVEGTVSAFNTNNNTVLVDGTSYGNSGGLNLGVSGVAQILTEEKTIDNTFIFYMDPAGNVLGYKETNAIIGNYAIVKGFDRTGNDTMGYSATVKLLMQDGTTGTYSLNLAASAVNLGLATAGQTTQEKEDAISKRLDNLWVCDPANVDGTNKLVNHLFSYTLENNTVTLSYANKVNSNYTVDTAAGITSLSKNTATYNSTVANDQTVFFIKDSVGDLYVVTGLSKLAATPKAVVASETVAYTAPGTSTAIAKAIFVTLGEKYEAAREYVYVTDKYVRTTTSGTPVYSFTVVYPDGTTAEMETKSNVNTIKNKVCEFDYDGTYVNFYPDESVAYNKMYVQSVANNTVTLGNKDTGVTEESLRINANAAIWDVQDEPVADTLAENDVVSLIVDTEGAVKAAFIYDVMNGTFVDSPLDPNSGSSITVDGTKLSSEGQNVPKTLTLGDKIEIVINLPAGVTPSLEINDTAVTMTSTATRATTADVKWTYTYTVTQADVDAGSISFSVTLSQNGLDPLTVNWTVGTEGGTTTPPEETDEAITSVTVTMPALTVGQVLPEADDNNANVTTTTKWDATGNVEAGKTYTATVTLTATDGYKFTKDTTVTAGTNGTVTAPTADTKTITVTYKFEVKDDGSTGGDSNFNADVQLTEAATDTTPAKMTMNYYLDKAAGETSHTDKAEWIKNQLNASGLLDQTVTLVTVSSATQATAKALVDGALKDIATVTLTQQFKVSLNGNVQGYYKAGTVTLNYTPVDGQSLIDSKAPDTAASTAVTESVDPTGAKSYTVTVSAADIDLWSAYQVNLTGVSITHYQVPGGTKTAYTSGTYVPVNTQLWVEDAASLSVAAGDNIRFSVNGVEKGIVPADSTPAAVYDKPITVDGVDAESKKCELKAAKVFKLMIDGTYVGNYFEADASKAIVLPLDYMSYLGKKYVQIEDGASGTVSVAEASVVTAALNTTSDGIVLTNSDTAKADKGIVVLATAVKVTFTGGTTNFASTVSGVFNNGYATEADITTSSALYIAKGTVLDIKSVVASASGAVQNGYVILVKVGTADDAKVVVADEKTGNAATWDDPTGTAATATYSITGTEELTFSVGAKPTTTR